jgi:plastocyanin
MNIRSMVSIATVALASAALLTGCPSDDDKSTTGRPTGGKPTAPPGSTQPASTATGTGEAPTGGGDAQFGKGVIKGTVKFSGEAPEMKVPKKRKEAEFCKDTETVFNAVLVKDGKLQDVWVGIANEQLKGDYEADKPAVVDQKDCMYHPRVQGVVTEQEVQIKNSDPTLHNVNAAKGDTTLFNTAQPKGAPDLKKSFEETGTYKLKCDVHAWMRSFVITSDNPFYAVTGEDGSFTIEKVPDGKYKVVAWHSQYGQKEQEVEVKGGEVSVDFDYDGKEPEPEANKGELADLF